MNTEKLSMLQPGRFLDRRHRATCHVFDAQEVHCEEMKPHI